jgi:hypothetical protein
MIARSLSLSLAVAGFALFAAAPAPSSAAPGTVLRPAADVSLVQQADTYKRRWHYRDTHVRAPLTAVDDVNGDTYVSAPFARVYSGKKGTWVRAPFVNLWIPR